MIQMILKHVTYYAYLVRQEGFVTPPSHRSQGVLQPIPAHQAALEGIPSAAVLVHSDDDEDTTRETAGAMEEDTTRRRVPLKIQHPPHQAVPISPLSSARNGSLLGVAAATTTEDTAVTSRPPSAGSGRSLTIGSADRFKKGSRRRSGSDGSSGTTLVAVDKPAHRRGSGGSTLGSGGAGHSSGGSSAWQWISGAGKTVSAKYVRGSGSIYGDSAHGGSVGGSAWGSEGRRGGYSPASIAARAIGGGAGGGGSYDPAGVDHRHQQTRFAGREFTTPSTIGDGLSVDSSDDDVAGGSALGSWFSSTGSNRSRHPARGRRRKPAGSGLGSSTSSKVTTLDAGRTRTGTGSSHSSELVSKMPAELSARPNRPTGDAADVFPKKSGLPSTHVFASAPGGISSRGIAGARGLGVASKGAGGAAATVAHKNAGRARASSAGHVSVPPLNNDRSFANVKGSRRGESRRFQARESTARRAQLPSADNRTMLVSRKIEKSGRVQTAFTEAPFHDVKDIAGKITAGKINALSDGRSHARALGDKEVSTTEDEEGPRESGKDGRMTNSAVAALRRSYEGTKVSVGTLSTSTRADTNMSQIKKFPNTSSRASTATSPKHNERAPGALKTADKEVWSWKSIAENNSTASTSYASSVSPAEAVAVDLPTGKLSSMGKAHGGAVSATAALASSRTVSGTEEGAATTQKHDNPSSMSACGGGVAKKGALAALRPAADTALKPSALEDMISGSVGLLSNGQGNAGDDSLLHSVDNDSDSSSTTGFDSGFESTAGVGDMTEGEMVAAAEAAMMEAAEAMTAATAGDMEAGMTREAIGASLKRSPDRSTPKRIVSELETSCIPRERVLEETQMYRCVTAVNLAAHIMSYTSCSHHVVTTLRRHGILLEIQHITWRVRFFAHGAERYR